MGQFTDPITPALPDILRATDSPSG